jgi:hypothetical protein
MCIFKISSLTASSSWRFLAQGRAGSTNSDSLAIIFGDGSCVGAMGRGRETQPENRVISVGLSHGSATALPLSNFGRMT